MSNDLGAVSGEFKKEVDIEIDDEEQDQDGDQDPEKEEELEDGYIDPRLLERLELVEKEIFRKLPIQEIIEISNKFRASQSKDNSVTLCYGEIILESFLRLLVSLQGFSIGFDENAIFVDVGSGPSKTLIIAGLLNVFKKAIGIEIIEGLHRRAADIVNGFNNKFRTPGDKTDYELKLGDGTFIDWSFANLVYIQATCFDAAMMARVNKISDKMKRGSVIIIINNRLLREQNYDLIGITTMEYSFGPTKAYIYRKGPGGNCEDLQTVREKFSKILNTNYLS